MTQQFVFTLTAAAIGFAASIFLFIGSISQSPKQMVIDTKPFWEFNPQALPYTLDLSGIKKCDHTTVASGYVQRGRQPVLITANCC